MATTVKIKNNLIERLDKKQSELSLDTRTNLVEVLLRKGLDFLDSYGYDELIKISGAKKGEKNGNRYF